MNVQYEYDCCMSYLKKRMYCYHISKKKLSSGPSRVLYRFSVVVISSFEVKYIALDQ